MKKKNEVNKQRGKKAKKKSERKKTSKPYKNRMSGKCPENVQNNNIQIPDTVYCPENVPKRDRFRTVSGHSFCPEFVIILDSLDLFSFWIHLGQFPNISWTFSIHPQFSGQFQDIF